MKHRPMLFAGAIVAALAAAGAAAWFLFLGGPGRFRGQTGDASVLLITVDTLRADRLGVYGYREIRTPAIDALADEGVLFENAVTPAVMTLPSHASILTGTYPPTHGIRDNGDYRLGPNALTLAEVLRARGFRTGAVVGSFVLDSMFGLEQGFELYNDTLPARRLNETYFAERPARAVTDAALRFLEDARSSRFFLWVHYFDPHHPWTPPPAFRQQYPRRLYDAEIAYTDSEIGRLLDRMRSMGMRDRTLVALVADHGEGLGDHGEDSHGVFVYEEASRVPMILWMPPHLPAGRRVRGVVSTVDLMPTLLELIRIDPLQAAAPVQGTSLWPMMADADGGSPGRPAYSEAMVPLLLYGWSPLTSIRDVQYKYIEAPRPELYDLSADPGEKNNLASARPDLSAGYRAQLETLRRGITREGAAAEAVSPDPETEAKLRSLGYVSGPVGPGGDASATGRLADPKDKVDDLARINRVYQAFGSGRHDVAIGEARALLEENPDNASVRFYLAGSLTETGRFEEALSEYRRLLERSPSDTETLSNVGWCLMNMERFEEAEKTFQRVLELYPDHIHAMASLGNLSFVKGDYAAAVNQYKQVLRREPGHLSSLLTLAGIYEGTGKLDEAAILYRQAAQVDPANIDVLMGLGWIYFQQGKQQEALASLRQAQALEPQLPELSSAVGDVLLAMKRDAEARAAYASALEVQPDLASALYGLGVIELRGGDARSAAGLLQRAVSLRPDMAAWRADLARAQERLRSGR